MIRLITKNLSSNHVLFFKTLNDCRHFIKCMCKSKYVGLRFDIPDEIFESDVKRIATQDDLDALNKSIPDRVALFEKELSDNGVKFMSREDYYATADTENMRDLCGEFYNVSHKSKKCMLIHKIPNIISMMLDLAESTGTVINWEHKATVLADAYDFMLNKCELSKDIVSKWANGEKPVKEFTDEEIDRIFDAFFKEFMSK